jgi:hypothetical protein
MMQASFWRVQEFEPSDNVMTAIDNSGSGLSRRIISSLAYLATKQHVAYALFIDDGRQLSIDVAFSSNALKCCATAVFYADAA